MNQKMINNAPEATKFLKALANKNRLLIMYHLLDSEKSVGGLENLLNIRQPTLSQQLARLRADHFVKTRRDAKTIYYSLASKDVILTIQFLHKLFCEQPSELVAAE
jgi:DNA-binding transcriptional ArsR family regulator